MPLFQTSVLNKYLAEQNKPLLEQQYALYRSYFLNATIQKNIIASKEEEFQEGFLRELFVKVLGYTINPEPDYNLKTELKNIKDSKKADGAVVDGEKVLAIIELKGTDTINLNQIEIQAFGYKNNQENCKYVITSNFQKLRFYIDNAIEFLEWDLFKLDFENFKLLYLCLGKDNIFKNLAATIKVESVTVEENVTKRLYKEYSGFRKALFNNIAELNANTDKLLLFKKTQKLLDRFLFLFFAEDRMLVPPNSVRKILEQWNSLKDMDAYQPLYARFKLYFGYLNTGHKGKQHDIFAYNGGLFAPDDVLDNIIIDDAILYEATLSLSNYDYNSEIDVNILGHIFEHSLTEIEELESVLTNNGITNNGITNNGVTNNGVTNNGLKPIVETHEPIAEKSKRKKDGVFYTPKYITKYIVENTVGTLCKNKKAELKIEEADYHPLQKKKALKLLLENLHAYRDWLLKITIIDPACGSGAFLNQALEFLIAEHKFISELEANITGSSIVFDVENSILENNLFGVDINEESVEIAKLSLWLRTARKGRKLNSLNNNIKCGNSLIDDESVAGDKAFIWEKEFPQVFGKYIEPIIVDKKKGATKKDNTENETEPYTFTPYKESETSSYPAEKITNYDDGIINTDFNVVNEPEVEYVIEKKASRGFDVVIGNPPYVRHELISNFKSYLEFKYKCYNSTADLYTYFYERGLNILKHSGILSYITPNKFINSNYGKNLRIYLGNYTICEIIDFGELPVFAEASTFPAIFTIKKEKVNYKTSYTKLNEINLSDILLDKENNKIEIELINQDWKFFDTNQMQLFDKIKVNSIPLKQYVSGDIKFGIKTGFNEAYIIDKRTKQELIGKDSNVKDFIVPFIDGDNVRKFSINFQDKFLILAKHGQSLEKYPVLMAHFEKFKDKLEKRSDKGDEWYQLRTCSYYEDFKLPKILYPDIALESRFTFDEDGFYPNATLFVIPKNDKYLLSLLNSKVAWYYFERNCPVIGDITKRGRLRLKTVYVSSFPVKETDIETKNKLIAKVDFLLTKSKALQEATKAFIKLLQAKFETININTKLEKWYNLSFADFSKELSKQKIKLSLVQESEWLSFFEQEKQKALAIKNEIETTDGAIDKMVYALYGLSEEEVRIVEGN
jgi:hypothetical protein